MTSPHIIFEDDDILIIEKPAGVIVNNSDSAKDVLTIQDWVQEKYKLPKKFTEESSEFEKRSGIVHRLDKETSGILIVAKNQESFEALQKQFKTHEIKKTYIALVHGDVIPKTGEINVPIGRLPWNRTRFGVYSQGRESQTEYIVLETKKIKTDRENEVFSLVELYPKTGRTHQIRVHMQYLGFPVVSDVLYAGRKTSKKDRRTLLRHFLHASKISFIHPKTRKRVELTSPLPMDLVDFISSLN